LTQRKYLKMSFRPRSKSEYSLGWFDWHIPRRQHHKQRHCKLALKPKRPFLNGHSVQSHFKCNAMTQLTNTEIMQLTTLRRVIQLCLERTQHKPWTKTGITLASYFASKVCSPAGSSSTSTTCVPVVGRSRGCADPDGAGCKSSEVWREWYKYFFNLRHWYRRKIS
jgi:hypothetical protein